MGRLYIPNGVNELIAAGVEHLDLFVFFRGEEKPVAFDIRRKMVKIAIVKSGQWDGGHQLQRRFVLRGQADRQRGKYGEDGKPHSMHTFLPKLVWHATRLRCSWARHLLKIQPGQEWRLLDSHRV